MHQLGMVHESMLVRVLAWDGRLLDVPASKRGSAPTQIGAIFGTFRLPDCRSSQNPTVERRSCGKIWFSRHPFSRKSFADGNNGRRRSLQTGGNTTMAEDTILTATFSSPCGQVLPKDVAQR